MSICYVHNNGGLTDPNIMKKDEAKIKSSVPLLDRSAS